MCMTNHRVAKKLKNSHFSWYYMILVLKAWGEACVVWTSLGFSCPREVWSTSKWQHIWFCVQAEGRWTPEVFISAAGGMSWGLLATQKRWTHSRDINQSLDEQDCHFLYECWKIAWPLILVCCVFGFYQLCINGGKCSQWNFLALWITLKLLKFSWSCSV